PRPVQLCQAFTDLAARHPGYFADARAALNDMSGREVSVVTPSEKNQIKGLLRALMTDHVRRRAANPQGDWAELLAECDQADADNGWVAAARAECLIERNAGNVPTADLQAAEAAAFKSADASQVGAYAAYVR